MSSSIWSCLLLKIILYHSFLVQSYEILAIPQQFTLTMNIVLVSLHVFLFSPWSSRLSNSLPPHPGCLSALSLLTLVLASRLNSLLHPSGAFILKKCSYRLICMSYFVLSALATLTYFLFSKNCRYFSTLGPSPYLIDLFRNIV